MAHKFDPAHTDRLESPQRYAAMPPERILRKLGLRRDMTFVDAGAGTGFFSIPAAGLVGPAGKVFACDVSQVMLDLLKSKDPPTWVETLLCSETSLPVKSGIADITLACFVLHEVHEPLTFLKEMGRVARPYFPIVVMEWAKRRQREGPPFEDRLHHHDTEALVLKSGLCFRSLEFINPSQYIVTAFRK